MTDDTNDTDEPERLRSEVEAQIALQMARGDAYRDGAYELDDWEGFHCTECGWRGLSAPMADDWGTDDDGDLLVTQCPECGEPSPSISDERTNWFTVLEKLIALDWEVDFGDNE